MYCLCLVWKSFSFLVTRCSSLRTLVAYKYMEFHVQGFVIHHCPIGNNAMVSMFDLHCAQVYNKFTNCNTIILSYWQNWYSSLFQNWSRRNKCLILVYISILNDELIKARLWPCWDIDTSLNSIRVNWIAKVWT